MWILRANILSLQTNTNTNIHQTHIHILMRNISKLYIGYLKPAKWSHAKRIAYYTFLYRERKKRYQNRQVLLNSNVVWITTQSRLKTSAYVENVSNEIPNRNESEREGEREKKNDAFKHFIIIFSTYFGAKQMTKPNKKPFNYGEQTYRFNHCLISQSQQCTLNFLRSKIIFTA